MSTIIEKLDERISYWNQVWADPFQQTRADAFIEAFDLVKEWLATDEDSTAGFSIPQDR